MAFTGLNVTFGFVITGSSKQEAVAPIYGPSTSSNNMAAAGTSNVAAPAALFPNYYPMVNVYSAVDAWITIGKTPGDPLIDGNRRLIPALTLIDIFCTTGDKVRWAPIP